MLCMRRLRRRWLFGATNVKEVDGSKMKKRPGS